MVSLPTQAGDERVVEITRPILTKASEVSVDMESRVDEVVLVGNPAQEIVEFATTLGVDLIVARTRGRGPGRTAYLGSVSNALIHRALCSVLIVR